MSSPRFLAAAYTSAVLSSIVSAAVIAQTPPALPPRSTPKALSSLIAVQVQKPAAAEVKEEMRGVWVVRDSLTTPQSVHQVVVTAIKYHLNTIFVQVRGRGDAWYDSPYEPRAEQLASQPASFDPLSQMVREAHASGLKVHAWLNTYLAWSNRKAPIAPNHLWNAHRNWFALNNEGKCSPVPTNKTEGAFLSPSRPEVQDHLFNVFTDVASRYDVDGIHFDYCRYAGSGYDFHPDTLARFRNHMIKSMTEDAITQFDGRAQTDSHIYVHAFGKQWAEWRRAQVTDLVTRISKSVKEKKPWMEVSAAVFPDANEAFQDKGQNWRQWIQDGILDAVALMSYDKDTSKVMRQIKQAVAIAGEKHVYAGIGAWRLPVGDVAKKIAEVRKTGAAGVNLFSYDDVHSRPQYLSALLHGVFASRSASPRMRWLPDRLGARTGGEVKDGFGSSNVEGVSVRLTPEKKAASEGKSDNPKESGGR